MDDKPEKLPLPEGLAKTDTSQSAEAAPGAVAPRGNTLTDIAKEMIIFTPALMVTHGRFDRDPVTEYIQDSGIGRYTIMADCETDEWFSGLPRTLCKVPFNKKRARMVDWARRLYMLPLEHAEHLVGWFAGTAIVDPREKYICKVIVQKLQLADWPAIRGAGGIVDAVPTVEITAFCAATLQATYLFTTPTGAEQAAGKKPTAQICPPHLEIFKELMEVLEK